MATGSGTGTAAVAPSAMTLTSLRARVLQQLTSAQSGMDPLPISTSALTLTTLRARLQAVLQDSAVKWSTDDLDEAIRQALEHYSRIKPYQTLGTINLTAAGREISVSSLTGVVRVVHVWWDYDSVTPGHPPQWRNFATWPGSKIYINDPSEPQSGDVVRVWYTKDHSINGLDSATATTIPSDDEATVIAGAAACAARFRAVELSEKLNVDPDVYARVQKWADDMMTEFRQTLENSERRPAFQYDQNDIDEAIRWALGRYNEIDPETTITTLNLAATSREISLATLSDLLDVKQIWWDYDAADPAYPPNWRDFELWPGDILYIKSDSEPTSGDVVRIWYTRLRTIYGLDSATTTSVEDDAETLLVTGAAGYAAATRIHQEDPAHTPKKFREWADARLEQFEQGLRRVARRQAARLSGTAATTALDRWDRQDDRW
jgi:hypothetical protein